MADANQKRTGKPRQQAGFAKFRRAILSGKAAGLVKGERYETVCERLTNGASSLSLSIVDGLMLVSYSGPVDQSFLMMGHTFAEATCRWQAKAAVIDFTKALIAFNGDALEVAHGCLSPEKMERPRALVIPQSHAGMFKQFALRAAFQHSAIQRGFLDQGEAIAWASEYASRMPSL